MTHSSPSGYPPRGMWWDPQAKEAAEVVTSEDIIAFLKSISNPFTTRVQLYKFLKNLYGEVPFEVLNKAINHFYPIKKKASSLAEIRNYALKLPFHTRMSMLKALRQAFSSPEDQHKIHQVMQEMVTQKHADFGFFDGPVDLGKNPTGDFPSVSWMPRGQEDLDADPNITTASKDLLPLDKQMQIAAKYGPIYNAALLHYYTATKNGHDSKRALDYAVSEMEKLKAPIEKDKLLEIAKIYLKGIE